VELLDKSFSQTDLTMFNDEIQNAAKERIEQRANLVAAMKDYSDAVFSIIANCKHPVVRVTGVSESSGQKGKAYCVICGVGTLGEHKLHSSPVLDFSNSIVLAYGDKPENKTSIEYMLSYVQQYAMCYPKRFTPRYLEELFDDSPYDSQQIIEADTGGYIVENGLIDNFDDYEKMTKA
jgi:hypothetical protein